MSAQRPSSAASLPRHADHPDRAEAQGEIHARPIVPIEAPARVRRVAFLLGNEPNTGRAASRRFVEWCQSTGRPFPPPSARRFGYESGARQVVWELHNEFVTFTWTGPAEDGDAWPADVGLETADGSAVIAAMRVDILATPSIPGPALIDFDPLSLCYSTIEDGRAQLATDFVCDGDGYTRYEFAAGAIGADLRGIVVRRLLEIETYRLLALVGIPLSRSVSPAMNDLEGRLAAIMDELGTSGAAVDSHDALNRLHQLQMQVGHLAERTRYRFSASRAYGRILWRRLDSLGETAVDDHRTLLRYLKHRIEPALWTFEAIERRQEALFEQLARTTALLNTRIGLDVQTQNHSILNTISDTAKSQYRLQTTVEGLSTIAITYYALGIASYMLHVLDGEYEHQKAILIAVLAPVILVLVWLGIRRIKKRHIEPHR